MTKRRGIMALMTGVALVVLALVASSASATYDQELTGVPATLEGSQVTQFVYTTVSGTSKCEEVTFKGNGVGSMTEPTTGTTTYAEITLHPSLQSCRSFGLAATWRTEGCNFVFTTATTTETAVTGFDAHAPIHIECEPGKQIIINAGAGGCITQIGEQTPGGVVDLKNEVNGTVTWQWTVEGFTYHQEGSKCTGGAGNFANGTMTGSVSIGGKNPANENLVKIRVT